MNINLLKNLQNRDMLTNLFIFFIAISLMQFFDSKIIISITCVILIFINFPKLQAVMILQKILNKILKSMKQVLICIIIQL